MATRDYYACVVGYKNRRRQSAELLRLSVWASLSSWEGSITFNDWARKFFPLWFDHVENDEPIILTESEVTEVLQRHSRVSKKQPV